MSPRATVGCEFRAGPEAQTAGEAVFLPNPLIGVRVVAAPDGRSRAPHALAERISAALRAA